MLSLSLERYFVDNCCHEHNSSWETNRPPDVSKSFTQKSAIGRGSGSIVDIATGYGLDGPGIESRWEARFSAPVQTGPGAHPASCTMGTRSFPGSKERPGRDSDPSPPSSTVGYERIELYLYSPYGPYGVYRASVSVQGCTLPLLYLPPLVCVLSQMNRSITFI